MLLFCKYFLIRQVIFILYDYLQCEEKIQNKKIRPNFNCNAHCLKKNS